MGRRGPLPGASYGQRPGPKREDDKPRTRQQAGSEPADPPVLVATGDVPAPPEHLSDLGRQVWADVWSGFPAAVLNPHLDALTVLRLAEAVEDRAAARAVLVELGPVLEEVIPDPRGGVVGTRHVPNPAAAMVRALDKTIDAASDRLGLSPAARARLGLAISRAQLAGQDAATLLAKLRKGR